MFPIPWNFPFRKKDGTLGKIEDIGASDMPEYGVEEAGKVLGVDEDGDLEWKEVETPEELPEYGVEDAGKVLGVDDDGDLEWKDTPEELPEYGVEEAGKVLGVDDQGLLEWKALTGGAKIYYKDFNKTFGSDNVLASFTDGAAASTGIHIADFNSSSGGNDITVQGYIPISGIAIDKYTGYRYGILIQMMGSDARYGYQCTFAIGSRSIESGGLGVRVFYVKNEDLISLNS